MSSARESLGRLALFLFSVIIVTICLGMLLSQLHMEKHLARNVVLVSCVMSAVGSYMACYKPGWLYRSLVDMSKEEE